MNESGSIQDSAGTIARETLLDMIPERGSRGPISARPAIQGWAKTRHEVQLHYFVDGRALCRLFYLEEGRVPDPAPPSQDEKLCGCCRREKEFIRG